MPANLPPQFYHLSNKLKEARSSEEKIFILEEMLAVCPKHKGTEKIQRELKRKIAKIKRQRPKKIKRETLYYVQKEGAGQIAIAGPANSGKSTLINALTNAKMKTANYPFTTQLPKPAMMPYQNILIQLVDTPPLHADSPLWLRGLLRSADGILVVFDASKRNLQENINNTKNLLDDWKIDPKKIIFLGNKTDLIKNKKDLEKIKYKIKFISCINKTGLEDLKEEIFKLLEVIRIYSKSPGKPPDFEHPFILKKNSTLLELAEKIHKDFLSFFKYAKLFKKDSRKPRIVGKDYILQDEDIIEIHA